MEEWITLVSNVGFPIAIAAYLLIRIEARMEGLSAAINQLTQTIAAFQRS